MEGQQITVRENNEYWTDVWSIPRWNPNLLQHLEPSHRVQFSEVMMDTHGSLTPSAHLLPICKDDRPFDLKPSLQLIKAFVCSTLEEEAGFKSACREAAFWPLTAQKLEMLHVCALFWQLLRGLKVSD